MVSHCCSWLAFFKIYSFRFCTILLSLLSISIIHIQTYYTEGFINTFDGFNNVTAKTKWSFPLSIFSVNVINSAGLYPLKTLENQRFSDVFKGYRIVDLVAFTEEILNGKLHFFVQWHFNSFDKYFSLSPLFFLWGFCVLCISVNVL